MSPRKRLACGWLGLVLLASSLGATAGRYGGVDDFELPPGMRLESIGEALHVNGVETRAWQFQSPDSADAIAAHFHQQWSGRIARRRLPPWDILSHRQDDWLVTVQMSSAGLGQTRGLLSVARAFEARRGRSPGADLPRLPRTRLLQDIASEDLGRRSRTLILLSEQSAAQNLDFYRAHFRAQGYEPLAGGSLARSAAGGAMRLNRGAEQLDIAVAQQPGHAVVAIVQVLP